jgi:beta-lactamase regulating signal transducer with metallopeptidase domain
MLASAVLSVIPMTSAADSAGAVVTVYSVSLLATVPMLIALIIAMVLRHAAAEGRVLVWRSTVVALLTLFVGQELPHQWVAWIVPQTLAAPLVELGRLQVAPTSPIVNASGGAWVGVSLVQLLFTLYLAGAALALLPLAIGLWRSRQLARNARPLDGAWSTMLDALRAELGIRRNVRLLWSSRISVPVTWGLLHPIILVPDSALRWTSENQRIVLLHELEHVRTSDWFFGVLARAMCALYWFHPVAWRVARSLRDDAELACDDRVLSRGTRRSDYAELLVSAADRLLPVAGAMALSERGSLRARLVAVLDVRHDVRPIARRWVTTASLSTLAVAGPLSAVQLAPTRAVLTTLMGDARWESRAYAVLGLAQRADSVAVARTAAERDPNPRVRAWARYALGDRRGAGDLAELRSLLHAP